MKLFKFVLIYIVVVSGIVAVLISGLVFISVDDAITKSNQQNIEREITGIKHEYNAFFKAHMTLLQNYAKTPLFTQTVMQPEINQFIITDVINNIRFFEEKFDLFVLDFEGNIINIIQKSNMNFTSQPWVETLIDNKLTNHYALVEIKNSYYWELAVPISYNNNNEGVLVVHIPTSTFAKFSNIESRLSGMSISLTHNKKLLEFLGEKLKGDVYEVNLDNSMGQLEFVIDTSSVTEEINNLFTRLVFIIVALGLITILIALYLTKKIVIQPLHQLQEGLLNFFEFVNRKSENVEPLKIEANNEIGDMAKIINDNILKTKNLIDEERETIADIAKTVEQFSLGTLDDSTLTKEEVHHNELLVILNTLNEHSKNLNQLNLRLQEEIKQAVEENSKKDRLLAEQSKLAAMGEMIGSIAHQWRQPLNTLALKVQFIEDDFEDGLIDMSYLKEYSKESMQLINFMSKTIDDFRDFFKTDKQKAVVSIKSLIQKPLDIIQLQLNNHDITLDFNGEDFEVEVIENELQQVILNIINNAKDAILHNEISKGNITIELSKDSLNGIILIMDNAGGIPENIIDRIFEPYFTTKEQGKGTGIGLYMSKMIIVDHLKGDLHAFNKGNVACFEVKIPLFIK